MGRKKETGGGKEEGKKGKAEEKKRRGRKEEKRSIRKESSVFELCGAAEPLCPQPGCMFFHHLSSFQGFRISLYLQNSQGLSPFARTISYSLLSSRVQI